MEFIFYLISILFIIISTVVSFKETKSKIIFIITSSIAFNLIIVLYGMPIWDFNFIDYRMLIFFNLLISTIIEIIGLKISFEQLNWKQKDVISEIKEKSKLKYFFSFMFIFPRKFTIILFIYLFSMFILSFSLSSPFFYSENYKNLIGNKVVKISSLSDKISDVKIDKIRTVDESLAKKLASKKIANIASTYEVGKMNIQKVNGDLLWVAPIEYKSLFKWMNQSYSPGYITVSAYNENDIKIIKNLKIKYLVKSGYWFDNVKRKLYFSGYYNIGLIDYTFEIDDTGRPYFVISIYDKTIGFSGDEIKGILTLDVQTGEIKEYSLKNIPTWIDRVQPEEIIRTQINYWGSYIHGWWNSLPFSSQTDVSSATEGTSLIDGKNGETYWYTGIKSLNGKNTSVGYMLVNTRNKDSFYFEKEGATESDAEDSAEGMVSEKNYNATKAIAYNINNTGIYFTTLKDNSETVKMYAFVYIHNFSIVGVGETITDAYNKFLRNLSMKTRGSKEFAKQFLQLNNVTIKKVKDYIENGNSYILFKLNQNNNIYSSSISRFPKSAFLEKNDTISFEYSKNNTKGIINVQKLSIK